jgi:hypothetical protein
MLTLVDTITGFVAIMLVLSMMVKSLTSLIKNHVDLYSRNLKHEVDRLALAVVGKTWNQAVADLETNPATAREAAWFKGLNWERLGDEFLTKEQMEWALTKLGAQPGSLDHLENRLQVHLAKLSYAFGTRMKNLALVIGLALCLGLDINSFAIWQSLYADQQLRTTFATTYAKTALQSAENNSKPKTGSADTATPAQNPVKAQTDETGMNQTSTAQQGEVATSSSTPQGGSSSSTEEQVKLEKDTRDFMSKLAAFEKDVSFGVGRVWSAKAWEDERDKLAKGGAKFGRLRKLEFGGTELAGSLLTGVLISIGAAYWHDLLRTITSFRSS